MLIFSWRCLFKKTNISYLGEEAEESEDEEDEGKTFLIGF